VLMCDRLRGAPASSASSCMLLDRNANLGLSPDEQGLRSRICDCAARGCAAQLRPGDGLYRWQMPPPASRVTHSFECATPRPIRCGPQLGDGAGPRRQGCVLWTEAPRPRTRVKAPRAKVPTTEVEPGCRHNEELTAAAFKRSRPARNLGQTGRNRAHRARGRDDHALKLQLRNQAGCCRRSGKVRR
jgi:hypothetical protein